MKRLLLVTLFALAVEPAAATNHTGNAFYDKCAGIPVDAWCHGYMAGMTDGWSIQFRPGITCPPPNVTVLQALDVVLKYLREHPERRHGATVYAVLNALHQAWPCPQPEQPQ